MRFAAIIFLIAGLAYLGWLLNLVITHRVSIGATIMVIFAGALLYQAYELFKKKPGARWPAIVSAGAIAIASGYIASVFVLPPLAQNLFELPAGVWPVFGAAAVVCISFSAVVAVLALTNTSRPNKTLNPDAQKQRAG
jgi:hypothetical protein